MRYKMIVIAGNLVKLLVLIPFQFCANIFLTLGNLFFQILIDIIEYLGTYSLEGASSKRYNIFFEQLWFPFFISIYQSLNEIFNVNNE